jgi:hypothetical protein
MTLAA